MKNYSHIQTVFVLMPMVMSFACGLDIYIPILPEMTHIFHTSSSMIQLTMSLFLLAVAIGQLFIGPLSDQFGRKKILYISAILFSLGSIGCIYSETIGWLILARIISGIGACGLLVVSFAIVRDLFSKEESAKMYSFLNGATGISPTFAPILGGILMNIWGWKSIFLFLGLFGVYSGGITYFFIKETLESQNRVKLNRDIFLRYYQICKNKQFITFSLISGCAQTVFFGFFSTSPYIIKDLLNYSITEFGYYFALFGLVLSLGSLLSGKMIEKFGIFPTIKTGLALMLGGGIIMMIWSLITPLTLISYLIPMIIANLGGILLVGSCVSIALEPFPNLAGTASAAYGCLEYCISSIIIAFVMLFPIQSTLPYSISINLVSVISIIAFIKYIPKCTQNLVFDKEEAPAID